MARHAAPKAPSMRPFILVISGVTVLAMAGIFIGLNIPSANAGAAAQVTAPSPAPVSNFTLNGYADGPAKKVQPEYVPKTLLDPDAVADPYGGDSSGTGSTGTGSGAATTDPGTGTSTGG